MPGFTVVPSPRMLSRAEGVVIVFEGVVRPVWGPRLIVEFDDARTVDEARDVLGRDFVRLELLPVHDAAAIHHLDDRYVGREDALREFNERTGLERPDDLRGAFTVDLPATASPRAARRAVEQLPGVRRATVDVPVADPAMIADELVAAQGHLDTAPTGVGWHDVWDGIEGGAGEHPDVRHVRLIDVEQGWTVDHQELQHLGINLPADLITGRVVRPSCSHGTEVLGTVAGAINNIGTVGIAHHFEWMRLASCSGSSSNAARAITTANQHLDCGDVLLLQMQSGGDDPCEQPIGAPIEVIGAVYDAIVAAALLDIVVVEAAGNGGYLLDGQQTTLGPESINLLGDSGAIMVGAASSAAPHQRLPFTCHGNRIDCYAWGENVVAPASTDWGADDRYTGAFGGTSAAAAIACGVICLLQEVHRQHHGAFATGAQIRGVLGDMQFGTPAQLPSGGDDPSIGPMPDLTKLVPRVVEGLESCADA